MNKEPQKYWMKWDVAVDTIPTNDNYDAMHIMRDGDCAGKIVYAIDDLGRGCLHVYDQNDNDLGYVYNIEHALKILLRNSHDVLRLVEAVF